MATYNLGQGHHQVLTEAVFTSADKNFVTDREGRSYLDLYTNESLPFGHEAQTVRWAASDGLPINIGQYATEARVDLVQLLSKFFPGYDAFQFNTSGTLANEGALRYAMAVTGRSGFAGFAGSFHGRSKALASLGDLDWFNGERVSGYVSLPYPGYDEEKRGSQGWPSSGDALKLLVDDNLTTIASRLDAAGAHNFAGVLIEPIMSKSVLHPPTGWLRRLRDEVLRPRDILLIADENFTSGRVGAWSSCIQQDCPADIITFSKSFSSGFPFAGVAIAEDFASSVRGVKGGDAGSAQAIQCRSVMRTLTRLEAEDAILNTVALQEAFYERTKNWASMGCVMRTDAYGALMGIEFSDKATAIAAGEQCLRHGVLVAAVHRGLRLTPALTMSVSELSTGLDLIERAIISLA